MMSSNYIYRHPRHLYMICFQRSDVFLSLSPFHSTLRCPIDSNDLPGSAYYLVLLALADWLVDQSLDRRQGPFWLVWFSQQKSCLETNLKK